MNSTPARPTARFTRASVLAASCVLALAAGVAGARRIGSGEARLAELEAQQRSDTARRGRMAADLAAMHRSLARLAQIEASGAQQAERMRETQLELALLEDLLGRQESALSELAQAHERSESERAPLAARVEELGGSLRASTDALRALVTSAIESDAANRVRLDEISAHSAREQDLSGRWRELMGPVVQLSGEESVGSGVVLEPRADPDGGWNSYVLTAWHVVRDILAEDASLAEAVPLAIYLEDGAIQRESARLLEHDARIDAALLELHTEEPLAHWARLAPRAALARVRVFERIYAVGCPLGNDPLPSPGEISSTNHHIDGQTYWMINAPTFIGNSGGGLFDARSRELLGIFSKIYNYGSARPTIVPHMGLVTPLHTVYDWLEQRGLAALVPQDPSAAPALAGNAADIEQAAVRAANAQR